jgi:hypothetical protein
MLIYADINLGIYRRGGGKIKPQAKNFPRFFHISTLKAELLKHGGAKFT